MRLLPLALLATGCMSATYRGSTVAPIADRAVVAPPGVPGERLGTIDTSGSAMASSGDLADRAAELAAVHGGTHVVLENSGVDTFTSTQPATESQTCTHDDTTNTDNCTTTYTPETTTTTSIPYATYDVLRVPAERWAELPGALRPDAYDPAHHTPAAADGLGLVFGGFEAPQLAAPTGTSGDVFPTAYSQSAGRLGGLWLAMSRSHGSSELALDLRLGGGSYEGMAANTEQSTPAVHYTGTMFGSALALRAGQRIAWQNVALAAGVGVAGALWSGMASVDPQAPVPAGFVEPPGGASADFYLPVWSSLTVKPSCSWGIQGLAEYDVRPLDTGASAPSLAVGVIWQPATACR